MSYLIWNRNGGDIEQAPENREEEILKRIDSIDCNLSPECLTCDGELSGPEVNRRYRALMAERDKLEKELGRKVESRY